jgi:hypothetical protein
MIYIAEWQQMLFLACPIMKGLNNLIWSGLFINDLRCEKKTLNNDERNKGGFQYFFPLFFKSA